MQCTGGESDFALEAINRFLSSKQYFFSEQCYKSYSTDLIGLNILGCKVFENVILATFYKGLSFLENSGELLWRFKAWQ